MSLPLAHMLSLCAMKYLLNPILFTLSVLKAVDWYKAHLFCTIYQQESYHEEVVHAVCEVVHDDPVEVVGVALEAPVHRAAGPRGPVIAAGLLAFLLGIV